MRKCWKYNIHVKLNLFDWQFTALGNFWAETLFLKGTPSIYEACKWKYLHVFRSTCTFLWIETFWFRCRVVLCNLVVKIFRSTCTFAVSHLDRDIVIQMWGDPLQSGSEDFQVNLHLYLASPLSFWMETFWFRCGVVLCNLVVKIFRSACTFAWCL